MPETTEPDQLEEKLANYEQKYYSLFNVTNDGIFLMTLEGVHFEVNQRAASMLGYTTDELVGLSFRDIVYEKELSDAESRLATMQSGGVLPLYERTFKRKDGTLIPVELNIALIRDKKGNPQHIQSIVRDLSIRKQLEQSQRESEKLYRLLAENAKDVIATLDMDLRVTYVSPSVKSILGYDVDELSSKRITDLISLDSRAVVMRALTEALELEESVGKDGYEAPPLEVEAYHKNGHSMWVEVSRVFLRDEMDQPTGILIIVRDIIRRRLTEEALQRSERRYREMIELNPEGIAIVDFDEIVLFCNHAFAGILGYEPQEIQGSSILDFVETKDRDEVRLQTKKRREGETSVYQIEMREKDGKRRYIRVSGVPWRNDEGILAGTISVITDITERVMAENALAVSNADLELYASLLRHDLRNDLQIVLSEAEAASILWPKESDLINICEITHHAAERMRQLINTFEVPENEFTDDLMELLETRARNAEKTHYGLKVSIVTEEDTSKLKITKGRLLPALFDNLLRNSYQHAGPDVHVTFTVSSQDGNAIIDFVDSGPGIPEDIRLRLFKKDLATAGKGQGLYLCRRIAEAYSGSIQYLDNDTKKGASFRIILPLR